MKKSNPEQRRENESRREFLGDVGLLLTASLFPAASALADATQYPAGDVRRYGIVPNNAAAASANTTALIALVSPSGSFSGNLVFPNTTGKDVYYFNDMIPFHDGVHIDLKNSTLNFSKVGVAHDTNAGFFTAIRDFSVENGSMVVDYSHQGGFNTGNALSFGGRDNDCQLFPNLYDSLLPSSMGKITVRNVQITSNSNGGEGRAILLLGGLDGVVIENVTIDGQGKLLHGIYYEFGWATNDPKPYLRQTSHGHNFQIKNLTVSNVTAEGFAANGLYRATVDGITVNNAGGVCAFGAGESMFFRTWSGVGDRKTKPNIVVRNANGQGITNVGIGMTGASKINASFLDNPPTHNNPNGLTIVNQTDLIDFTLDTFSINGTANNYGISTSAERAVIRNGTLKGFQRGIVTTQDCTKFLIDSVNVLDSTGLGMQIGRAGLETPPRVASGVIRRCVVAGSGTAGASAAIVIGGNQSVIIEGCRFGYDQSHDNKTERTQTQAVSVSADSGEVTCRDNFVGGTAQNSVAYSAAPATSAGRQARLMRNSGITTSSGAWTTLRQGPNLQSLSSNGTIPTAGMHVVWVAPAGAVSGVKVQPGTQNSQAVVIVNEGAASSSISFAGPDASNVAGGSEAVAGLSSRILTWNAESKLWHSVQPGAADDSARR